MLRKITYLTTLLTLLIALAACGASGSEPGVDDGGAATGGDETPATQPTDAPEESGGEDGGIETLPPVPEQLALVDTSWQLVEFGGGLETQRPIDSYDLTLEFTEAEVSGSAGCNGFGASYTATSDGELTFDTEGFFRTLMDCMDDDVMDVEDAYLAALRSVTAYEIGDEELRLTYADGVLVFQPPVEPEPEPLEGTAWYLNVVEEVSGDAVSASLPQGIAISATFEDGQIAGNSGCNQYSASYTLNENNELSIGPAATTRMACGEEIMSQETAFLDALAQTTDYEIEGTQLRLNNPGGALIFTATDEAETDIDMVMDRIVTALQEQNLDLLGENMTVVPSLAIWPDEPRTVGQAGVLNTLADSYLVEGADVTISADAAAAADLLDGQDPRGTFAGSEKVVDVRLSQGWGADGGGEALLWIVQQPDGRVRLGGLVLAPQGF